MRGFQKAKRSLLRFGRARDGATVVEFALVAAPFFLMMVGLAEIALIGFAQTTLDYAVSDTARSIRTGQVQMEGQTPEEVERALCDNLTALMPLSCNNLYLDVDEFSSFVDVQMTNPIRNGEFNESGFGFEPGAPSAIVVVRAYYRWETVTPFFKQVFANVSNGERLLASTMMFRNEPFPE